MCSEVIKYFSSFILADGYSDNSVTLLKRHYVENLQFQCIDPQLRDGKELSKRKRNEIFVDLAVINTKEVEKEWMNCDRQHHLKTHYKEKSHIAYKDVLQKTDEGVLLRGIAGIGKTSMLNYMMLQWAQNAIWNGNDNQPDSQYVFSFNGRVLNLFQRELSVKDLFKRQYPFVSFELIQSCPKRVVLIFDGLDEFKDIESFCEPSCHICSEEQKGKIGDILHYVFDRNCGCLPGHKSILAGRPEAINTVFHHYDKRGPSVKRVDIVGFSKGNVEKYIKNFADGDEELEETIDRKIRESDNLGVMSYVPVYLWIICSIFKYDDQIPAPSTITELYILILGIYLREHFKGSNIDKQMKSVPLPDLFKIKEVQNLLSDVSKFSYEMSSSGKVVFTRNEMEKAGLSGNFFDNAEKHGFIVRVKDDTESLICQFRHLTLQEFFVALEFFRKRYEWSTLMKKDLRNSEIPPILAGLLGGRDVLSKSPSLVKTFVKAVGVNTDQNQNLLECLYNNFFSIETRDKGKEYLMLYLFCCYEFGNICHKIFQEHVDYILFLINKGPIYHHQLKHLVHFLKCASKEVKVKNLVLHLTDLNITMHDVKHIVEILPFVERLSLHKNTDTTTKVWQDLANEICRRQGTDFKVNTWCILLNRSGEILSAVSSCIPFIKHFDGAKFHYGFDVLADQICRSHESSAFRLETLVLASCNLTDQQQADLVKCFRFIRKIILNDNTITVATCQSFTRMISEDTRDGTLRVEELSLHSCKLKESHFVALADCLPLLKVVTLTKNHHISLKSCEVIKNSICRAAMDGTLMLENIDLSYCSLKKGHFVILADCIPYLKIVTLGGNDGGSEGCKAFGKKIYDAAEDGKLVTKQLSLMCTSSITDEIVALSRCLPYLQMVRLGGLGVSPFKCLKELNDNICKTAEDRTLVLEELQISCIRGDTTLCLDFLRYLKAVDLSNNHFTVDNCKLLKDTILEAAEDSTFVLEEVTLRGCSLTKDHFFILADCIAYLKIVDLSDNRHSGLEGVNAVQEKIKAASMNAARIGQNPKLQDLNLCGSIAQSEQLMVLVEVLPYIKSVNLGERLKGSSKLNWKEFVETFKKALKKASKLICSSKFVLQTIIVPEGRLSGKLIHSLKTAYPDLEVRFIRIK